MNKNPVVSVYIPTFNRAELLRRAVDSVLGQSFQDLELIVVDDGSSDGTVKYMRQLASEDRRVRFFKNEVNSGACHSRNKAIEASRGMFVTGLDDDDYFSFDRIEKFVEAWSQKPVGVIGLVANSIIVKGAGRKKTTFRPKFVKQRDLFQANYVGNQIFALKETYLNVGGFDKEFPAWQDLELWYRILDADRSRIMCIKEATYFQDISHEHERISNGSGNKIEAALNMFIEKHGVEKPYSDFLKNACAAYGFDQPSLSIGFRKILTYKNLRSLRDFSALIVKKYIL